MITRSDAGTISNGRKGVAETSYFMELPKDLTLLHITHWKAGSQWFRGVLEIIFGPSVVIPDGSEARLFQSTKKTGVYPCVYLSPEELAPLEFNSEVRQIIIIRDLRDTLVSGYFSLKNSHVVTNPFVAKWRNVLSGLNEEEGLLYVMDHWLNYSAMIQKSWFKSGAKLHHFEDLTSGNPALQNLFQSCWKLKVPEERLDTVKTAMSFNKLSGGRAPGIENTPNHYRKGTAGDWRNHFTPKIRARLVERYGELLVETGYEQGMNW